MLVPPPSAPAERLAGIIDLLCRALGGPVARPGWPGMPAAIPAALLLLIWGRLRRLARRIARVAEKIAAGIPPAKPRRRAPRPHRPPPDAPAAPAAPPPLHLHLPRGRGWLVRLVGYGAAAGTSQLEHLLKQPEMAPLLADPRMARLLRPLCHLLGATPPPEIATPPRPLSAPGGGVGRGKVGDTRNRPVRPASGPRRTSPQACGPPPVPA